MVIDYTITVGNIIEIAAITAGGVLVLISLKNTVANLKIDVDGMQQEIKKLAAVLTEMAVANNRLTNIEEDIRELKHYRGFVLPDQSA
jgi:K+/H+ antiporter YhaU regulatory subunit KhtT